MKVKDKLFYSFKDGSQVSQKQIDKWHKESLDYLLEHKKSKFYFSNSGNGLVIALKFKTDEGREIRIYEVDSGYTETTYEVE